MPDKQEIIHVTIIEDDDEQRENWATLLRMADGFSCVSAYADCESALKNLAADQPEVILLDIRFGEDDHAGVRAVPKIKQTLLDVEIIMVTIQTDDESIFKSLCYGAHGYLVKNVPPGELLEAIENVHKGGSPMSMGIARRVAESFQRYHCLDNLSARQKEVLEKLCEGKNNQTIANELFITKSAVKFHIRNIYQILHVANRAEAMRVAMGLGL